MLHLVINLATYLFSICYIFFHYFFFSTLCFVHFLLLLLCFCMLLWQCKKKNCYANKAHIELNWEREKESGINKVKKKKDSCPVWQPFPFLFTLTGIRDIFFFKAHVFKGLKKMFIIIGIINFKHYSDRNALRRPSKHGGSDVELPRGYRLSLSYTKNL